MASIPRRAEEARDHQRSSAVPPAGIAPGACRSVYAAVQSAEARAPRAATSARSASPVPGHEHRPLRGPGPNVPLVRSCPRDQRRSRRLPQGRGRRGRRTQRARPRRRRSLQPTDGGKTYTFQVQVTGIRYSNGQARPAGRTSSVSGRAPRSRLGGLDYGAGLLERIVGAERGIRRGKPCDLGQRHRRRPRRPDRHLPSDGAGPGLPRQARPARRLCRAGGDTRARCRCPPAPGHGAVPNRVLREKGEDVCVSSAIASSTSGRRTRSRRDIRIRSRFRGVGSAPADPLRSVAVRAGSRLTSSLSGPFAPDTVQGRDSRRLSVRYPSQLHLNTEVHDRVLLPQHAGRSLRRRSRTPGGQHRLRPSTVRAGERPRVRPHLSVPTSRHPRVPSHLPVRRGRRDESRRSARRLVKSSGTAGARVTVWAFEEAADQERFMVSVLRLARVSGEAQGRGGPRRQPFPGVLCLLLRKCPTPAWAPRPDTSPSWERGRQPPTFLPSIVSCAGFVPAAPNTNSNLSEFCDRSIDAQMAHASAVQAQDPPAATLLWQQVRALACE